MDQHSHDKVFVRNFGAVLGVLFAIFFICMIAARIITPKHDPEPQALAQLEGRIGPVTQVITDPAALLKVSAAKAAREPYTAEQVLNKACNACHMTGVLGAPKEGDKAAWSARLKSEGGLEGLLAAAIKGKNSMPARGGDPSLSDEELKSAIQAMLKQSGV